MSMGEKGALETALSLNKVIFAAPGKEASPEPATAEIASQLFRPGGPSLAEILLEIQIDQLPTSPEELEGSRDRATVDLARFLEEQLPGLLEELLERRKSEEE
jgi:hypothetical protein